MVQDESNLLLKNHFYNMLNITISAIKNGLINLIKIENYVQQFEGASLIKHGSLLKGLAFTLINFYRFVLFTKYYYFFVFNLYCSSTLYG